jgi:glycosyltransferase involved in cell wall biosynthesis
MKESRLRIVHLTSVPCTLWFLEEQMRVLQKLSAEVTAISSPGPELDRFHRETGVATCGIPITRTISPLADARSLWKLYRAMRRIRPGVVVAGTPKAGLLGVVAARLARCPAIVFQVHGLPHTSKTGFRGLALRACTRIACSLSHKVICVSRSNADLLVKSGFCPRIKVVVPAQGSACGVDAQNKFNPSRIAPARTAEIRLRFGIPADTVTLGFAGRLVIDKGCRELVAAWQILSREYPNLHLLVAGEPEPHDPLPFGLLDILKQDSRVHFMGTVRDMPSFFATIDVLALPTYREGFPVVVLEASAMAIPVVASRVTGCIDAVVEGRTGTLVEPCNPAELAAAIRRYVDDEPLRRQHGQAARERVLRDFQPSSVIAATLEVYRHIGATEDNFLLERATESVNQARS